MVIMQKNNNNEKTNIIFFDFFKIQPHKPAAEEGSGTCAKQHQENPFC